MEQVNVYGQLFTKEWYDFFMNSFKESFSHASLSIESAFEELKTCEMQLKRIKNEEANQYYQLLDPSIKKEIDDFLKYCVVCRGHQFGILIGQFDINTPQDKIEKVFEKYFPYMLEDMHNIICFTEDGKLDKKRTFMNTRDMFRLSFEKKTAEDNAHNMKEDHIKAFNYALGKEKIGVLDIIIINEMINHSDPNREIGFKKTDNMITGASFQVASKETTPIKMQELLADYENNFGLELKDYKEPGISSSEKYKRVLAFFEKEARFHIDFVRIHPFADGNGRCARILMNKHLIEEGLPPVLITNYMIEEYKEYITNKDYKGLAKMMLASSSQLLSNWVSIKKSGILPEIKEDNSPFNKK